MKIPLKKVLMLSLVVITGVLGMIQNLYAQSSSLTDSLKKQLTYIEANTKDTALRKEVKEAQDIYNNVKTIDDSLSKKLLIIDSILYIIEPTHQIVVFYTENLVQLFKDLL